MRDGSTRQTETSGRPGEGFEQWEALLVVLEGGIAAGTEFPVLQPCVRIGRGPDVELELDDPEMSSVHASILFDAGAFHLTDLGSTNGTQVNDRGIATHELSHGDRIRLGGHVLQLVVEKREAAPRVHVLPDDE
jgi:pSer/pThr/pTyr-binding forkhead associated (FHA) protein